MKIVIALLLGLIAPVFLLPIEYLLPYPYVLEELVKLLAVSLVIYQAKQSKKDYWAAAFLIGILFTISESTLYLVNFLSDGNLSLLPQRLVLTGLLHSSTSILMYLSGRISWWLLIIGLVASMFIHYYFNTAVSTF